MGLISFRSPPKMARVDADRNLLLGILAQQMDFVSRDALFEAMNAWIIRKETPLGALLVERGDLAKSRRDLLEALVEEHVRAHGGRPRPELAGPQLGRPGGRRPRQILRPRHPGQSRPRALLRVAGRLDADPSSDLAG